MSGGQHPMPLNRGGYGTPQQQPQSSTPFSMHMPGSLSSTLGMGAQHQQQYPGINSIPGMHSMSQMNGIQNISGLQGMPAMQSFSSIPGISAMQSLLHPTSAEPAASPSLSSSHLSNTFGTPGILSGGVEKRRKQRPRQRSLGSGSVLGGEDPHSMMMAAQQAAQAVSHPDQAASLAHSLPVFQADGVQFKILEQLPDTKIQRLRAEKIKPIESLTFSDIKAYNRNQLRAYCSVYGIKRKKKAEMERDMARYAALFHPNDPAYDISKFQPTEYADGPIPRRKVPVTKEQKERAAGDPKKLTNALQQRPQANSSMTQQHFGGTSHSHHHVLQNAHNLQHHSTSLVGAPRLHDIHGTQHGTGHGGQHHGCVHGVGGQHESEHEAGLAAADLMNVPEMVPNHLLGISNHIGEE